MVDINELKEHIREVVWAIYKVSMEFGELGEGYERYDEFCYQNLLELELAKRGIPFKRDLLLQPSDQRQLMNDTYRLDLLCKDDIIVECKAVEQLTDIHRAQLFNYMRLLKMPCGILVSFAPRYLELERYFYDDETQNILADRHTKRER